MSLPLDKTVQDFEPYMTPDESAADFVALLGAIAGSLSPVGYLEGRQVELIAHCDWEISRHRRQSTQLLKAQVLQAESRGPQFYGRVEPKLSTSELVAQTYSQASAHHAHHEEAVAHLERRRNQLLKEFNELRAQRRLTLIADAEVAEP